MYNVGEPQAHHAKWRKTDTKDYILHDPIYMRFLEMEKSVETEKQNSNCLGKAWEWGLTVNENNKFQEW